MSRQIFHPSNNAHHHPSLRTTSLLLAATTTLCHPLSLTSPSATPTISRLDYAYEVHDGASIAAFNPTAAGAATAQVGLRLRASLTPIAPLDAPPHSPPNTGASTNDNPTGCLVQLHLVSGSGQVVKQQFAQHPNDQFMGVGEPSPVLDALFSPDQDM